jgi:TRAP-type C4-dicarboxylate transport system substrate-binding protein
MVFEFGFGRLTSHHYLLHLGAVPTALVMNRKKLESLPKPAQALIRKYSGEWLSSRASACFATKNRELAEKFKADLRRTVVEPSPADLATARSVFASVVEEWAAKSPHNRELLTLVRAEIAKLRSSKETRP